MSLPICPVHDAAHPPVLCHTEHVYHPVVCVEKEKVKDYRSPGMNLGHLSPAERETRAIKNARNRNRVHPKGSHGLDMPVGGSSRR